MGTRIAVLVVRSVMGLGCLLVTIYFGWHHDWTNCILSFTLAEVLGCRWNLDDLKQLQEKGNLYV